MLDAKFRMVLLSGEVETVCPGDDGLVAGPAVPDGFAIRGS